MTDAVLLSMLDRQGTLRHRAQTGVRDAGGNKTWETTTSTVDVYVEQLAAPEEITVGQTTALSTHRGVFPSGTVVDASDALDLDEVTYEVVGHPWRVWEPGAGESHVEVRFVVVS